MQGIVEYQRKRGRFDQAVGRGWVIMGHDADPLAALTAAQRAQLSALEGFGVALGAPGSGAEVIDTHGTYARWLTDIDARHVLVRPDFYVAVTAHTPENFRRRFDEVMAAQDLQDTCAEAA